MFLGRVAVELKFSTLKLSKTLGHLGSVQQLNLSRWSLCCETGELERGKDGVGRPINVRVVFGQPGFAQNQVKSINLSKYQVKSLSVGAHREGGGGKVLSCLHYGTVSQPYTEGISQGGGGQLVLAHEAVGEEVASSSRVQHSPSSDTLYLTLEHNKLLGHIRFRLGGN